MAPRSNSKSSQEEKGNKKGMPWSKEDTDFMIERRNLNRPFQEIAECLGRSNLACRIRLCKCLAAEDRKAKRAMRVRASQQIVPKQRGTSGEFEAMRWLLSGSGQ